MQSFLVSLPTFTSKIFMSAPAEVYYGPDFHLKYRMLSYCVSHTFKCKNLLFQCSLQFYKQPYKPHYVGPLGIWSLFFESKN
jgi:hypothetical protein